MRGHKRARAFFMSETRNNFGPPPFSAPKSRGLLPTTFKKTRALKKTAPIRVFASIGEWLATRAAGQPVFQDFHVMPLYAFGPTKQAAAPSPVQKNFYQLLLVLDHNEAGANGRLPAFQLRCIGPEVTVTETQGAGLSGMAFFFSTSFLPLPESDAADLLAALFEGPPVRTIDAAGYEELMQLAWLLLADSGAPRTAGVRRAVLGAGLLFLLHKCLALPGARNGRLPGQSRPVALVARFRQLLEVHFLTHRTVSDYARLLDVTPGHLNDTVKDNTGWTAGAIIAERLLTEAKHLLADTDMEVAGIARQLHFANPSHFGKFFKKSMGETPLNFRRSKAGSA